MIIPKIKLYTGCNALSNSSNSAFQEQDQDMAPPFSRDEYSDRLNCVRTAMQARGLDVLVIGDPANINWLTGYDAWSFYTPQIMVVGDELDPTWLGREMDAGAAKFTTYLPDSQIVPFPEIYVQQTTVHPAQFMAEWMKSKQLNGKRIGYESDVYYLTPAAVGHLKSGLPNSDWSDCGLLVNWQRLTKSRAEIVMLQQASVIAGLAMQTAYDGVRPGVRQNNLMADIVAAQIRGTPEFGGDQTALHPLVLAGEAASTAHPMWTDATFEKNQTIAFELGGCRKRYNAGLARTVHLGEPPKTLMATAKAVEEGMEEVLSAMKAHALCSDVHAAWQAVLDQYGLKKNSRIGYSIGLGYSPDWGEHTISFRPDDHTALPENAVVHIILGMWNDSWGMELSETIHVRANDAVCLTQFPRDVHVIDV
ncbi:MAG: Xaa-Pro aminopeptidase [Paracoccaceae bacterium]